MPPQQRIEGSKSQERHATTQGRPRPDQQPQRPPQESRRKRGDHRSHTWGDGIDRAWCTKALSFLPETFAVESHGGAATIAPAIVDRQEQMILLCNFSHSGAHEWPALMSIVQAGDAPIDAGESEA